jgi:hypothetical protein
MILAMNMQPNMSMFCDAQAKTKKTAKKKYFFCLRSSLFLLVGCIPQGQAQPAFYSPGFRFCVEYQRMEAMIFF